MFCRTGWRAGYLEGFEDRSFIDGRTLSGEQRRGTWLSDKPLVFTGDVLRAAQCAVLVIKVPQSVADEYIVHDVWPGDEVFLGEGDAP